MTRTIELEIDPDIFGDFAEKLGSTGLDNRVTGKSDADEIQLTVYYDKVDEGLIEELEEYLETLQEELRSED